MVNAIGIAQMEVLNGKESKWIVNRISTNCQPTSIDYQYKINTKSIYHDTSII